MSYVRNPDGIWVNSNVFREEGEHFKKYGYYVADPYGSPSWYEYWKEQRNRCIYGYSAGGARITGDHYFYLNFCPIQKVDMDSSSGRKSKKVVDFPDFWDGDYNYFWIRQIAREGILSALSVSSEEKERIESLKDEEKHIALLQHYDTLGLLYRPVEGQLEGGRDLIIGKSRRKGYSFKNASIACCNFFHRPRSYTMVMAYEKKYLYPGNKTFFGKCLSFIGFINDHTAWKMPSDYINKQGHIRASYKEYKDGVEIEKGFLSEIECISFKDNPDAGRGADAYDIFGEEVGAWGTVGGLKNTLTAMRPSVEAGIYKTGMITLFGTSGSMDSGTIDFADLFGRPEANGFMAFYDRWGKFDKKKEGFFHPKQLNTEGFYDRQGNSDFEAATQFELQVRETLLGKGAVSSEIQKRMQEEPLNSAEAFSLISRNTFPVVELQRQRDKIIAMGWQYKGTPVQFYREGNIVRAKPILDGKATPIVSYKDIPLDIRGCPVIYEYPIDDAPRGLYKIGYDPIRQDEGTSLAAIIVYKGTHTNTYNGECIVAEYVGRYEDPDDIDRLAEFFADFYNTTIMYENEVTGVKNYFRRIKRLNLLSLQPDLVISKNITKSRTARIWGCHMNEPLKDAGERYTKSWLLMVKNYDENGDPVTTIDGIYSLRLLEELISYFRKGNFDLISALFMCMFQVQEQNLGQEYGEEIKHPTVSGLLEMYEEGMYKRRVI